MRRIVILAALVACAVATQASAATIGSTATSIAGGCGSDVLAWNLGPESAVPAGGGIITSIGTNSSETGGHISLKLFRLNAGKGTVVFTTTSIAVQAGANTVAVHVPVSGGEVVGMYTPDGADCAVGGGSAAVKNGLGSDPGVGTEITPDSTAPATVAVFATFEPDADHDGFGDETEDTCPTDPAIHTGPCVTDLTATQTVTPTTIGVGDVAVATVTLANGSTGLAQGVTLKAAGTPGLQVVGMFPGNGCSFTPDLACSFGSLVGGANSVAAVVVRGVTAGAQTLTSTVATTGNDPNAGNNAAATKVTVERRVALKCNVPSLKGLTKAIAKRLLTVANCKLGKATKKAAKKGTTGTVIKQSKKAGSKLKAGSKVNVTLKK
jgi:Domain of unknown function DUF11/PASTA domain